MIFSASGDKKYIVFFTSLGDASVITGDVVTSLGSGNENVVILSGSGENNVNLSGLGDTSVATDEVVILSGSGDDKGAIEARTRDLGLDARFKTLAYDILAQYNLQQSWVESFEFYQFFFGLPLIIDNCVWFALFWSLHLPVSSFVLLTKGFSRYTPPPPLSPLSRVKCFSQ